MTMRIGPPLITGAFIVGDSGLGVEGINIPGTGEDGPSVLFQYVTLPADNDAEFRMLITTLPSVGTLTTFEDGSFIYDAPIPTTDSFTYEWFKDGVTQGSDTVNLDISSGITITGTITQAAQSFTQSLAGTNILNIDGSITQSSSAFTQSANGTVVTIGFNGTINQTASSFTQLANGIVITNLTGTITQTTGAFTQLANGLVVEDVTGVMVQTISSFTQSATGVVPLNIPVSGGLVGNQSTGNGLTVNARLGAGITGKGSL